MASTQTKYLEFRQYRDFGEVLNATFEFITKNFGNFFKVVFSIAGPFFILGTAVLGLFGYRILNNAIGSNVRRTMRYGYSEDTMAYTDIILLVVCGLVILLGMIALYLSIYGFIKIYMEKKSDDITVAEVFQFVKQNALRYIGSLLVLIFMFGIVISMIVLIMVAGVGGIGGFLVFILFMLFFAIFIYQSLFFAIVAFEDVNPFEAVVRGFQIVAGHWWFTLGIAFVLGFLNTILNSLVQYSAAAIIGIIGYNSYDDAPYWLLRIGFVSFAVLVGIMFIFISSITVIKNAVLYFSFVEKKDSVGLFEKIQALGGAHPGQEHEIKVERSKQQYTNEETDEEF